MISNIRSILCSAVAITLAATVCAQAQQDARYVDMSEVFKNYYKTVRSQKALKKQEDIYKQRAEELSQEIQDLRVKRDELAEDSLNVAISEDERNKSKRRAQATENLYQAKQQQLRDFLQDKQEELRGRYLDMRKDLVDEILDFIRNYAEQNDIGTIYDVSGLTNNLLPVVIHYPEDREITERIISELNKGHEDEIPPEGVEAPSISTE